MLLTHSFSGLILAGSADFKTELSQSDMFDQRLQVKVIKLVDVSYGGENGFNQVIGHFIFRIMTLLSHRDQTSKSVSDSTKPKQQNQFKHEVSWFFSNQTN